MKKKYLKLTKNISSMKIRYLNYTFPYLRMESCRNEEKNKMHECPFTLMYE